MALVKRLTRLLTADAHAVLDKVEDPMALLKQSIRDMAKALESQQNMLQKKQRQHEKLGALLVTFEREAQQMDKDLDLCFSTDKLSLARVLVKKKLLLQRQSSDTEQSRSCLEKSIEALTEQLKESQSQYEATCLKSEALGAVQQAENTHSNRNGVTASNLNGSSYFDISEAEVDIALLKEQQARAAS